MPNITSIVEIIQLMLAPGIMISACGLLLLGMNNKYSLVVNRIRLLNEERRKIIHKTDDKDFNYQENLRLESISLQITKLVYRVKLVRNAVLSYTIAVALFVITSLSIGFGFLFDLTKLNSLITILFLLGMVSVLCGIVFFYNTKRLHASLNYLTPEDYLLGRKETRITERELKLEKAEVSRANYWKTLEQAA